MNHRPLGPRRTIQFILGMFILAWATQTLLAQWGYGAVILPAGMQLTANTDKPQAAWSGPTLELRSEAVIDGSSVTLRDVCRWSAQDEALIKPIADAVVAKLTDAKPVHQLTVEEIQAALHDTSANLSQLRFSGAASCVARRQDVSDAMYAKLLMNDSSDASDQAAAKLPADAARPAAAQTLAAADVSTPEVPQTSLRDLLVSDLSKRFNLPADRMQITFGNREQPSLILTEPRCKFDIDSTGAAALGDVAWTVRIRTDTTDRQATITARALAWQDEVVLTHPLSKGEKILDTDLTTKKELVTKIQPHAVTDMKSLIGQALARNVDRDQMLLSDDVKPLPVVEPDQYITISMKVNGLSIETVATAMDEGAKGQNIRARNEATGEIYQVIVTGPGQGEVSRQSAGIAAAEREPAIER